MAKPHAVAIPFPAQGHVSPFIHLCRALARKGFVVSFVSVESNLHRIRGAFPEDEHLDIRHETVPDNLPVPLADLELLYQDNRSKFLRAIGEMEAQLEELLATKISSRGPPVTCVILDSLFHWTQDACRSSRVPRIVFWTASTAPVLLDIHLEKLVENGDVPVQDPSSSKLIRYIPGVPALPIWSLPHDFQAQNPHYDPEFPYTKAICQRIKGADMLIFNTFEELEPEAMRAMKETINHRSFAVPVFMLEQSFSRNPSLWQEDRQCLEWLDKHETGSVLYISFGSIGALKREQVELLLAGLEELERPYLWVSKLGTGVSVHELDDVKLRVCKSGGFLVPWVPQLEVLMHPATGGFVSHCGWNSVLETMSAGVPVLCWPCFAEQNLNCKLLVEDVKIGIKFSKNVPTKDDFVGLAQKLMGSEGRELRNNAKLLRKSMQAAAGGSSQRNLEEFIQCLVEVTK